MVLCSAKVCEMVVVVFDAFALSDCGSRDCFLFCRTNRSRQCVDIHERHQMKLVLVWVLHEGKASMWSTTPTTTLQGWQHNTGSVFPTLLIPALSFRRPVETFCDDSYWVAFTQVRVQGVVSVQRIALFIYNHNNTCTKKTNHASSSWESSSPCTWRVKNQPPDSWFLNN